MTNPFQDRQPGELRPEHKKAGPKQDGGASGYLGVLLIILGIPFILLGLFLGMCTLVVGPSGLLFLTFVCLGGGAGLIAIGGGLCRNNGEGETND